MQQRGGDTRRRRPARRRRHTRPAGLPLPGARHLRPAGPTLTASSFSDKLRKKRLVSFIITILPSARREGAGAQRARMAGTYQAISEMGAVEVLEPHDRAYFTAYIIDIQEGGKKTLVRSVMHAERPGRRSFRARPRDHDLLRNGRGRAGARTVAATGRLRAAGALGPCARPVSAGSTGTRGRAPCWLTPAAAQVSK